MTYYRRRTKEPFTTTALYPNRIEDKKKVIIKESGNGRYLFYIGKILVAKGYLRVVYGDHGPYIEFHNKHIKWDKWKCEREGIGYFDKWYPINGERILLYKQTRTVSDLENPPKGSRSVSGFRVEGYADYRVGRCYISAINLRKEGKDIFIGNSLPIEKSWWNHIR